MSSRFSPQEEIWLCRGERDPQCNAEKKDGEASWPCMMRPDHPGAHVEVRGNRWPVQVDEPGLRKPIVGGPDSNVRIVDERPRIPSYEEVHGERPRARIVDEHPDSPQARAEKEMDVDYVSGLIRAGEWVRVREWIDLRMPRPKGFPDEGPGEGGTRTAEQWLNAMGTDVGIIREKVREVATINSVEQAARSLALAVKEAERLKRDIYRYGSEAYDIAKEAIDEARHGL